MRKNSLLVTTMVLTSILTIARIPLKLFMIDPVSGFYSDKTVLGMVFNVSLIAVIIISFFNARCDRDDFKAKMRVGSTRTFIFSFSAVAIAFISVLRLKNVMGMEIDDVNSAPKFMLMLSHILGIFAGIILLFLAVSLFSGAVLKRRFLLLSLVLPVWASILSLTDFLSFRYTVFSSDEFMETLFMVFATLFFLYLARSFLVEDENKKYLFPASGAFITGISLSVPQLVNFLLLKNPSAGPGTLECLTIFFISTSALCFILPPSKHLD